MSNLQICLAYHQKRWDPRTIKIAKLFEKPEGGKLELDPPSWATTLDNLEVILKRIKEEDTKVAKKAPKKVAKKPAKPRKRSGPQPNYQEIDLWLTYVRSSGPLTIDRATSQECPQHLTRGRVAFMKYNAQGRQKFIDEHIKRHQPSSKDRILTSLRNPQTVQKPTPLKLAPPPTEQEERRALGTNIEQNPFL